MPGCRPSSLRLVEGRMPPQRSRLASPRLLIVAFTYAARTIDRRATGGEVALLSPSVACSLPSPASHGPSVSTNAVVGTVPNITYMTRISCRRWTRATLCPARILLYTARDAQCDKLAEVVGRTSTVANVVNCRQFVIKRLRQPILDYRA